MLQQHRRQHQKQQHSDAASQVLATSAKHLRVYHFKFGTESSATVFYETYTHTGAPKHKFIMSSTGAHKHKFHIMSK